MNDSGQYTVRQVLEIAKEITGNDVDTDNGTVETANGNTADISDILDGAVVSWYYTTNDDNETVISNGIVTLEIGDYVNYTPESGKEYISKKADNGYEAQTFNTDDYIDASGKWQVLGVDEDTEELLIVSSSLIKTSADGEFYLYGQAGYVNCESELNKISKIFGTGTGATGAKSITLDDVNEITGFNPETDDTDSYQFSF